MSDLDVRDALLTKMKQGKSLALVLSEISGKLNNSVRYKYDKFKSHIEELQNVIDQNAKAVSQLTESLQAKNDERQGLLNEDKIKQGRPEHIERQLASANQVLSDLRRRETELTIQIHSPSISLPDLQSTAEQEIIAKQYEQITALRVDALTKEDAWAKATNAL